MVLVLLVILYIFYQSRELSAKPSPFGYVNYTPMFPYGQEHTLLEKVELILIEALALRIGAVVVK